MNEKKPEAKVLPPPVPRNLYSWDNGMDYYGHMPNGYGRCIYIEEQGGCPPPTSVQEAYLLGLPLERVRFIAASLSIPYQETTTQDELVPLIMAVYFP